MTTVSAWLSLLAVVVAIVGIVVSTRRQTPPARLFGLIATFAVTVVTGWFAWYSGIQV